MKRLFLLSMMFIHFSMGNHAMAEEQTVTLTVENMTCSLCPVTVRKALQAVDGVHEANISLEENKAVITFDDDQRIPKL